MAGYVIDQSVALLVGVLITARFYFTFFFLVEGDMGPIQAFEASWQASRGNHLKVAVLLLLNSLLPVLGLLVLVVGIIPAINLSLLLWVSAYRQIVGQPQQPGAGAPARV